MEKLIDIIIHTDDVLIALVAENLYKAYLLLFFIIMFETGLIIFPFLPGDGLLFSAGVVASSTDLNVWVLLVILILAAIIGNVINYSVGISMGAKLKRSNHYFIKNHIMNHLPEAQHFYDKHGGRAIILGRFFPIIRTYIPFLAGIVRMEKKVFLRNTVFGAISWISLFLLMGFFVGVIPWVKNNLGLIFIALVVMTLIPLLVTVIKRKKSISN